MFIAFLSILSVTSQAEPEAISLLGKPLFAPAQSAAARKVFEDKLAAAKSDYDADPASVDKCIWVGRWIAYQGRFREAIKFYTESLERFGPNAKLLRHRGHRYITIRKFDDAIADYEKAAKLIKGEPDEIEPDGMPNPENKPIGSLHSNIWYHLALAHYLKGNYERALGACKSGLKIASNNDRLVSQTYWTYLTYRKLGREEDAKKTLAKIHKDLKVIENHAYLRLLLFFKGEMLEDKLLDNTSRVNDFQTVQYGVGAFELANGDKKKAQERFSRVVEGTNWPAFGFIAAEAELARK